MGLEAITLGAKVFVFHCPVLLYIVQSTDAQRGYRDQVSPGPGPWLDSCMMNFCLTSHGRESKTAIRGYKWLEGDIF